MRSVRILLFTLVAVFLAPPLSAHPLADWVRGGNTSAIERAVADGRWAGTPTGDLAEAVLADAARAVPVYRRVVQVRDLPGELRALAWHRLHGYSRIAGDRALEADAARWLNDHATVSAAWFPSGLPAPPATTAWAVQIGAFSSPGNADRLAADQRARGFTVQVDRLARGSGALHAVRVGRFPSEDEAETFAERVYGTAGTPYRVVEIDL